MILQDAKCVYMMPPNAPSHDCASELSHILSPSNPYISLFDFLNIIPCPLMTQAPYCHTEVYIISCNM